MDHNIFNDDNQYYEVFCIEKHPKLEFLKNSMSKGISLQVDLMFQRIPKPKRDLSKIVMRRKELAT